MILSLPICPTCGAKVVKLTVGPEMSDVKRCGGLDVRDLQMRWLWFSCNARARETWPDSGWKWERGCPKVMTMLDHPVQPGKRVIVDSLRRGLVFRVHATGYADVILDENDLILKCVDVDRLALEPSP